jgi:hypothetical protein
MVTWRRRNFQPRPFEGVRRKVVRREEVPYELDIEGNPMTRTVEILECGHRKRVNSARKGLLPVRDPGQINDRYAATRFCKLCPKETPDGR